MFLYFSWNLFWGCWNFDCVTAGVAWIWSCLGLKQGASFSQELPPSGVVSPKVACSQTRRGARRGAVCWGFLSKKTSFSFRTKKIRGPSTEEKLLPCSIQESISTFPDTRPFPDLPLVSIQDIQLELTSCIPENISTVIFLYCPSKKNRTK